MGKKILKERILCTKTIDMVGEEVNIKGWVANFRDHGKLIFMDFRDWSGIIQVVINKDISPKSYKIGKTIGKEWVVSIVGKVVKRSPKLVNEKIKTGEFEIICKELEVLNKSKLPPLPIETDGKDIDESVRLKYRFLDLRRERLAKIMQKRHKFVLAIRNWMDKHGFTEVTTPLLTSTSPEGARDFLIPSRIHKGKFFVLPQAPQIFKQLLMVSGVDRYFQIAPCARDEDPRADRHAGVFYQIDMEMSFPTMDMILKTAENLMKDTYGIVAKDKKICQYPFPRISYSESIDKYGTDKPDLRFELQLVDLTSLLKNKSDLKIFNTNDSIKAILVEQPINNKQIHILENICRDKGAKGLAYLKYEGSELLGNISKFIDDKLKEILVKKLGLKDGWQVLLVADNANTVNRSLAEVRTKLADMLGLIDKDSLCFAWITGFPFYEKNNEGKLDFGHNPFSMPKGGLESIKNKPALEIESYQYDLVLNGYELASGSIRNHDPETLVAVFEKIGYSKKEILNKFGCLYNAFKYGAPPHGGWAIGIDRLLMILLDEDNIRDVYAFPKNSNGVDLLMNAPSKVSDQQLKDVGIKINKNAKK